jgi:CheY-like chemotaxis protein
VIEPASPAASTHTATILLIEDDRDVRSAVHNMLVRLGHRVLDAPDGAAAITVSAMYPDDIDLVLADLDMPECDGPSTIQRLRLRRPALRHVYMTGHIDGVLEDRGWVDLDGCLVRKPFSIA